MFEFYFLRKIRKSETSEQARHEHFHAGSGFHTFFGEVLWLLLLNPFFVFHQHKKTRKYLFRLRKRKSFFAFYSKEIVIRVCHILKVISTGTNSLLAACSQI